LSERGARAAAVLRRLAHGWIERQVHGAQQAGLADLRDRIRRHGDVGFDGDVETARQSFTVIN
jgi:hypothetical protein